MALPIPPIVLAVTDNDLLSFNSHIDWLLIMLSPLSPTMLFSKSFHAIPNRPQTLLDTMGL